MAISYTQQRTNVPAPVAQLPSLLGRGDQQQQQQQSSSTAAMVMPPPPSDLLLRLWSVIQRLEDEVNVERERNNVLTTQVDNLADRLAASNTLLATLSGIPPPPPTADAPVTAFSSTSFGADSHVPVVAAAHEESSRPSYRSVVTGSGPHLQHLARGVSSPSSDVSPHHHEAPLVDTNFPDHGVPLWHVLRSLSNVDEKRVFTVRKIQKLGFESPPKLREYFSMWGKVTNILVLHRQARTASTSGGDSNNDKNVRVRPPSVGFVVMEDPDVVSRILSTPKHVICGHSCEVQVFERKHRHSTGSSNGGESFSSVDTSTISSPTSPESSPASGMSNKSDEFELPAFMRELRSADVGGISLLPSRQKRNHRRRNGGMPDLTPDDVVSFMPPFTPDRRGSSVEEMQEEQDDPTIAVATPFTDLGMYDDLEVPWSPQERAPSVASGSPASSLGFPRSSALRTALEVLWAKQNEPTPTFQGLVRENPVKAFMEVLVMSSRGGCNPSQAGHWCPILLGPSGGVDLRYLPGLMIVMHGLGDTAQGWENAARIWSRQFPSTRFILPTAKGDELRRTLVSNTRARYDIKSLTSSKLEASAEGIEESAVRIREIISKEMADTGVTRKDI
ncbi:acyl-protein thioesterase, partial [Perkinsus olseni]